mgnify:CR=1 FL=1
MRYIFYNQHQAANTRKVKHSLLRKITVLFPFIILFQYNCSKDETVSETITETVFVTKKDAYLYGDVVEKNIIDEIPAFIKIKTKHSESTLSQQVFKPTLRLNGSISKLPFSVCKTSTFP